MVMNSDASTAANPIGCNTDQAENHFFMFKGTMKLIKR